MSTLTDEPRESIPAATPSRSRRRDARLAVILGLFVAALAAVTTGIVIGSRGSEPPPATGAAALVPADALAYVHLSTDPQRPAVRRAIRLAARFPDLPVLAAGVSSRLGAILGGSPAAGPGFSLSADLRPWLGNEAAFALLNTPTTTAGSLIVLDVRNRARAASFLAQHGASPDGVYRRVALMRYPSGTELAFVRHYLAVGQRASVQSAIDASAGAASSLQASASYRRAAATEPDDRLLDAYVSADGMRRVLAPRGGALGALAVLLLRPALSGAAISVSAAGAGARVTVHSTLDPTLARLSGSPPARFTPTLASVLPARSALLLDVRGLAGVAPTVLSAGAVAGIAPRIGPLLRRLGSALAAEGVDVHRLLSIFSGETAVAVSPARAGGGRALVIVARTSHPEATRAMLAELEGPLAQLFPAPSTGPGLAPVWNDVAVAGVGAHQLSIAPGLQLDYAVFHGLVVVSTSLRGIAGVAGHVRSLAGERTYRATLSGRPDQVTSLLFLDFSQLLNLAEQTGLTRSARLAALRPDLEKIRAIGLTSTSGEADTTAELFLQIP